jgi:serine/threonine protein kinase
MTASPVSTTEETTDARRLAQAVKRRWAGGATPDARAALSDQPALLGDKSVVLDLAYEEYCLRSDAGEELDADAYCERFPAYRTSLRRLLAAHQFFADQSALPADWPAPGTAFGDFTLQRELGRGAFARVYLATEASAGGRLVALKLSREPGSEARTLGVLSHPNVVPVLWARPDPGPEGFALLVMPFLGAATLHDLLDRAYPRAQAPAPARASVIVEAARSALRPGEADLAAAGGEAVRGGFAQGVRRLALGVAEGLAFLHARGVAHRDLKPSNILLTPEGRPLLLDFNLCADVCWALPRIGGTLPYMAPEQVRALVSLTPHQAALDERADLYSLGVILYELLTGRAPFGPTPLDRPPEETAASLLERQRCGCRPVRHLNPQVDPTLAGVVERCLSFDPARRPSAAAAAAELRRRERTEARRPWLLAGAACVLALAAAAWGLSANWSALFPLREKPEPANAAEYLLRGRQRLSEAAHAGSPHDRGVALTAAVNDLVQASANGGGKNAAASLAYALALRGDHMQSMQNAEAANQDNADAVAWCKEAEKLGMVRSAALLNNRAYCRMQLNRDLASARTDLNDAVGHDPKLRAARYNRALLALQEGLTQTRPVSPEALADIEAALEQGDSAKAHAQAALLYALAGYNELCLLQKAKGARELPRYDADERARDCYVKAYQHAEKSLDLGVDPRALTLRHPAYKPYPEFNTLKGSAKGKKTDPIPRLVDPLEEAKE